MNVQKPLAGIAVSAVLVALVGAAASLVAGFGDISLVATAVLLAVAMFGVVGAGVAGAGGVDAAETPYWWPPSVEHR